MKNSILRAGDLVKYHAYDSILSKLGFELNRMYAIKLSPIGALYIDTNGLSVDLVDALGQLTEHADYFAKHKCPVVLPMGNAISVPKHWSVPLDEDKVTKKYVDDQS